MEYYDDQYNSQPDGRENGGYARRNEPNRMALISMFCGIFGTLSLCCCLAFPISLLLGVVAIVLAFQSRKGQPFSGYAIAGLVLGIISLIFGIAIFAYLMLINQLLRDPQWAPFFDQVMEQYEAMMGPLE